MGIRAIQIVLVAGALILIIGLVLAPRLPVEARAEAKASPADLKLSEAIALVNNGENPMQGIQIMRELLEEDSTNVDVHWHLAQFSITSRQIENAAFRFQKVLQFDQNQKYPEAYFWLAQTNITLGQPQAALPLLIKYKTIEQDTIILRGVDRMIEQLQEELK